MPASLWKWRESTYEVCLFLLLILSTSTVMVIPISTPAASNKAITLMTSPVAIWGNGFSAEERNKHWSATLNRWSSFSLSQINERLHWQQWWNYLRWSVWDVTAQCRTAIWWRQNENLPMMLTSTEADRVPMLLVASHTYVPCKSYVSGPLKMRTLSLISALLGIEPLILQWW